MHLIALVASPDHVCARYRLRAFRSRIEQSGHRLDLVAWPQQWWSRLALAQSVRQADAVVLQRRLLPAWQLYSLRCAARRLIFDFDDAVFLRDSYARKGLHSTRRLLNFTATMEAADVVVAGNAFLAGEAARWTESRRVQVIPTCVDADRYPLAEHRRAGAGVQLVWVGSSSTLRGLEAIRPLLEDVGRRCAGVALKLICDRFLRLQHLPVIDCPWSETYEAADIATADIGISWVPDDLWSRGKCGLKVLQYMAAGLPVVANPVGVQADMVRHGETGFLAETPDQWVEAVARLARDPALRRTLGQAGRRRVQESFSVAVGATHWLEVLHQFQQREAA